MNVKEVASKVKNHIKENKAVYIGTGIGLIVGAAGAALLSGKGDKTATFDIGDQSVGNVVQANTIEHLCQRISIYGNVIGRHGNPVREIDPETGRTIHEYATQRLAALDTGTTEASMRKHLNGEHLDIKGRTFERMNLEWITMPGETMSY
jgi:hypothetical protein